MKRFRLFVNWNKVDEYTNLNNAYKDALEYKYGLGCRNVQIEDRSLGREIITL